MNNTAATTDREREREWLAALGHELNSSLNSLVLGVTVAEKLMPGDIELARHHLAAVRRNAVLMGRLVTDHLEATLLGMVELEVLPQKVELGSFLPHAVQTAELPGPKHPVRFALQPGLSAQADPDRLQQILTNLLSNAAKYATPGPLTLGATREADRALVWLTDEGPGLEARELELLFQRYSRPPSRERGLGLGLWLSREIARLMGGDLWATSQGSSSTFHLSLPAAA
ncbi:MAG: sensor histidine kinase [Myxococcaceae bacterium]